MRPPKGSPCRSLAYASRIHSVNTIRHPRGRYTVIIAIHCCLWSGHTRKQSMASLSSTSKKVGARCRRSPSFTSGSWKDAVQFTLVIYMRLAKHPTALHACWLVQAARLPGSLVKTRRAPSGHMLEMRESWVMYDDGHAQSEYTPPLPQPRYSTSG